MVGGPEDRGQGVGFRFGAQDDLRASHCTGIIARSRCYGVAHLSLFVIVLAVLHHHQSPEQMAMAEHGVPDVSPSAHVRLHVIAGKHRRACISQSPMLLNSIHVNVLALM